MRQGHFKRIPLGVQGKYTEEDVHTLLNRVTGDKGAPSEGVPCTLTYGPLAGLLRRTGFFVRVNRRNEGEHGGKGGEFGDYGAPITDIRGRIYFAVEESELLPEMLITLSFIYRDMFGGGSVRWSDGKRDGNFFTYEIKLGDKLLGLSGEKRGLIDLIDIDRIIYAEFEDIGIVLSALDPSTVIHLRTSLQEDELREKERAERERIDRENEQKAAEAEEAKRIALDKERQSYVRQLLVSKEINRLAPNASKRKNRRIRLEPYQLPTKSEPIGPVSFTISRRMKGPLLLSFLYELTHTKSMKLLGEASKDPKNQIFSLGKCYKNGVLSTVEIELKSKEMFEWYTQSIEGVVPKIQVTTLEV